MKIYNLGSINIDHVYALDHFVRPGETISCGSLAKFAGGKGYNQSVALARAGAQTAHIGAVGADGAQLVDALKRDGADVSRIAVLDGTPTGHAIIQVNPQGQNCIIIAPGANAEITDAMVDSALAGAAPGDILLAQNETSAIARAMRAAKGRGMKIALNPAPMNERVHALPLELVDILIVNEIEGAELSATPAAAPPAEALDALRARFPSATIVLTLGKDGVVAAAPGAAPVSHGIYSVRVVDSTAAGDCFAGYLLASLAAGAPLAEALRVASIASSISVSRAGASPSIPTLAEVKSFAI